MRTALKKDERILLITRQHWVRLIIPLVAWIALAALLFLYLDNKTTAFLITLAVAAYPLYEYLQYQSNLWCVTNLRVVDENGFFSRHSKESPLDKINNVEYEQTLWGRLFGFGNVDIQTAAELGETTYRLIEQPKLLKDTITHAQEEYRKSQISNQASELAKAIATANRSAAASQQLVADEIGKLYELLQKGAITQAEYAQQKRKLLM